MTVSLKRGFKANANRIALKVRADLGLLPHAPIDLARLAKSLNIEIVPLSAFAASHPKSAKQLMHHDRKALSGCLIPLPSGQRILLHNDAHPTSRQNSNIAHELAHALLEHDATAPIDEWGCRNLNTEIEEEANWLGGVLLITDEAALHIVRSSMAQKAAQKEYGVSSVMLKLRLNMSGALIRAKRAGTLVVH